jgi:hypothetical protein
MSEEERVKEGLRKLFPSAKQIFVETELKECSAIISVDDFQGELIETLIENKTKYEMVDLNDVYPYKYVFAYKLIE